jgi:hypothetical protein
MKSITIHGLDDPLDTLIRQRAKKKEMSLNKTIKELLREALGLESIDPHNHKKDFQDLFGVWTKAEAEEFARCTEDFEKIDQADWT